MRFTHTGIWNNEKTPSILKVFRLSKQLSAVFFLVTKPNYCRKI